MTSIMKLAFFFLAGSLFGFGVAVAQMSAFDPVRVAPHIYDNVLENGRIRVLKVTTRNGETPPVHSHPARLIVFLSPCAWLATAADGNEYMESFRLGDVRWAEPETHGGVTSDVIQDCSSLEVELK